MDSKGTSLFSSTLLRQPSSTASNTRSSKIVVIDGIFEDTPRQLLPSKGGMDQATAIVGNEVDEEDWLSKPRKTTRSPSREFTSQNTATSQTTAPSTSLDSDDEESGAEPAATVDSSDASSDYLTEVTDSEDSSSPEEDEESEGEEEEWEEGEEESEKETSRSSMTTENYRNGTTVDVSTRPEYERYYTAKSMDYRPIGRASLPDYPDLQNAASSDFNDYFRRQRSAEYHNIEVIDRAWSYKTADENEEQEEETAVSDAVEVIQSRVFVEYTEEKGRCLHTKKAVEAGEIIYTESPVMVAIPSLNPEVWSLLQAVNEEAALELPPVWHLAAICSLTMLSDTEQAIIENKWVSDPDAEASDDVLRILEYTQLEIDPKRYERFLGAWRFNSFGHHTENDGLVLYNITSMMAHSCHASACWHYGENDTFVLRARQALPVGGELTISYIGDDDLYQASHLRREKLSGWLFNCMCERCHARLDTTRGFRCPKCSAGTFFLRTNTLGATSGSACSVCQTEMADETLKEYVELEDAYIERLEETNAEDMEDAELVVQEAVRVFNQHWTLYQLHTTLFEGYRDSEMYESAILHQQQRLKYMEAACPKPSYVLAWIFEELGDVTVKSIDPRILTEENVEMEAPVSPVKRCLAVRSYEAAASLLGILCGDDHEYTQSALNKSYRIGRIPSLRREIIDADDEA